LRGAGHSCPLRHGTYFGVSGDCGARPEFPTERDGPDTRDTHHRTRRLASSDKELGVCVYYCSVCLLLQYQVYLLQELGLEWWRARLEAWGDANTSLHTNTQWLLSTPTLLSIES
jgi:hypothetical protein